MLKSPAPPPLLGAALVQGMPQLSAGPRLPQGRCSLQMLSP